MFVCLFGQHLVAFVNHSAQPNVSCATIAAAVLEAACCTRLHFYQSSLARSSVVT